MYGSVVPYMYTYMLGVVAIHDGAGVSICRWQPRQTDHSTLGIHWDKLMKRLFRMKHWSGQGNMQKKGTLWEMNWEINWNYWVQWEQSQPQISSIGSNRAGGFQIEFKRGYGPLQVLSSSSSSTYVACVVWRCVDICKHLCQDQISPPVRTDMLLHCVDEDDRFNLVD